MAGMARPDTTHSIAETSSGSFVEVWNQAALTNNTSFSTTNLYFRTFQESTDTAGPLVTDFIDPYSGDPMQNGDTITDQLHCIVVTFDSNMMTTGPNSVTSADNWDLLLNGTLVTNGIGAIYYGMNEAALNPLFASLHAPATNKWQAVIMLNGQGSNQGGTTSTYLQDGHYQLIATTALEDQAGNALGRTGYQPNGVAFSRSFNIVLPSKGETLINTGAMAGNQITSEPNSQATASDANGDYVVVWSSAPGQNLSFALSSPGASGYFRLAFNGANTGDIYFNPTNLATTAANIQAALAAIEPGTTVLYDAADSNASTGNFVFDVAFAPSSTVLNRPPITLLAPSGYAATPLAATMSAVTNLQRRPLRHAVRRQLEWDQRLHQQPPVEPDGQPAPFHHFGQRHANGRRHDLDQRGRFDPRKHVQLHQRQQCFGGLRRHGQFRGDLVGRGSDGQHARLERLGTTV